MDDKPISRREFLRVSAVAAAGAALAGCGAPATQAPAETAPPGLAAARRSTDMQNLSGSISDVMRDAVSVSSPVNKLRLEIDKLKSKTITVTVQN